MGVWQFILKPAEIILGIALLYFRFCLYETEEGHLQNALIDLWIRIAEKSASARKRFERLLEESARLSERIFVALFGPRLLSLRALLISVFLLYASSRTSATLFGPYYDSYTRRELRDFVFEQAVLLFTLGTVSIVVFAAVRLNRVTIKSRWGKRLDTIITLALLVLCIGPIIQFWAIILLDYLWLVYIRRGTHWALRRGGIWRHLLMVIGGAVATVVCFAVFPGRAHSGLISREWLLNHVPSVTPQIIFLSDSRFFIAAVSSVQLGIIALGFLNWVVWPILSRIAYAAERNQFFRERKLFAIFGFALLVHAAGGGGWVKNILELLARSV